MVETGLYSSRCVRAQHSVAMTLCDSVAVRRVYTCVENAPSEAEPIIGHKSAMRLSASTLTHWLGCVTAL